MCSDRARAFNGLTEPGLRLLLLRGGHNKGSKMSFDPPQNPLVLAHEPRPSAPGLAFSVQETAELLGVSSKSVRRLIARGLLRPSKALRHKLIPKKEIERFLDETR